MDENRLGFEDVTGANSQTLEGAEPNISYDLPSDQDWLLTQIVSWAEIGIKTGITLYTNGQIASGVACGEAEYIGALQQGFAGGLKGSPVAQAIDDAFSTIIDTLQQAEQQEGERPYPQYLHLSDARIFAPGSVAIPTHEGVFIRLKLSAVSGFSLGQLQASR